MRVPSLKPLCPMSAGTETYHSLARFFLDSEGITTMQNSSKQKGKGKRKCERKRWKATWLVHSYSSISTRRISYMHEIQKAVYRGKGKEGGRFDGVVLRPPFRDSDRERFKNIDIEVACELFFILYVPFFLLSPVSFRYYIYFFLSTFKALIICCFCFPPKINC